MSSHGRAWRDANRSRPVETVLAALRRTGRQPSAHGDGWKGKCPAHDDRNPSLSIATGKDERVLLYCHAGCRIEQVLAALSLTMGDLFMDRTS